MKYIEEQFILFPVMNMCFFCLSDSQKHASKEPFKENAGVKPIHNYLVPTPFVVANSTLCSVPGAREGIPSDKLNGTSFLLIEELYDLHCRMCVSKSLCFTYTLRC